MPRGLDLTATQTLSTARFRAILVYDDLHYPFDLLATPAGIRENNKNNQLHCQPTLNAVIEIKGLFWEVSNRAPWTLT